MEGLGRDAGPTGSGQGIAAYVALLRHDAGDAGPYPDYVTYRLLVSLHPHEQQAVQHRRDRQVLACTAQKTCHVSKYGLLGALHPQEQQAVQYRRDRQVFACAAQKWAASIDAGTEQHCGTRATSNKTTLLHTLFLGLFSPVSGRERPPCFPFLGLHSECAVPPMETGKKNNKKGHKKRIRLRSLPKPFREEESEVEGWNLGRA